MRLAIVVLAAALAGCRALARRGPDEEARAIFEGARAFDREELEHAVAESLAGIEGESDPRASVDDAAFDLELLYRDAGYAYCAVRWSIEGSGEDVRALFVVDEGPRVTIEHIRFQGRPETAPSVEALAAAYEGAREGLLGTGDLLYVESRVQARTGLVERLLRENGWLEARASATVEAGPSRERVRVLVTIDAGPSYVLGALPEVELAPARDEPPPDRAPDDEPPEGERAGEPPADAREPAPDDELARLAALVRAHVASAWEQRVGKAYDPRWPSLLSGELLDLLANEGRPDAQARVRAETRARSAGLRAVELVCALEPGAKVTIGEVRFTGNEETDADFLLARLGVEPDSPYDAETIDRGVTRLYGTGLFESVGTRLEGEGAARALVVDLLEAESREVFVEPGFGSYELFRVRGGIRERNLYGSGLHARAEAKVAVRAQELELGLLDPWFLRTPLASDLSLEYERREEPSFTTVSRGAAFLLTYQSDASIEEIGTTTFGYQFRRSDLESESIDEDALEELSEAIDLASVRVRQRYERPDRRSPLMPNDARFAEAGLEHGAHALGSELEFLRATAAVAAYETITGDWVASLSLRGGWITPLGDDDAIPLQERFFNGGENSVRSFQESELGPKDEDGDPLGGEGFGTLNLELRHPFWRKELFAAAFFDAGYVVPDHRDFFEPTGSNTATAVGLGVRYFLPVGPVRLDLGFNPDAEDDEDDLVLHFSLGLAF